MVKSATTLRAPFFFVANESRYLRMPPYSDTTEATDRDSTYSTNPVTGRKENRLALETERESIYLALFTAPELGDVDRTL